MFSTLFYSALPRRTLNIQIFNCYCTEQIARPLGLHYNHYVRPFVRPLPVRENGHNS